MLRWRVVLKCTWLLMGATLLFSVAMFLSESAAGSTQLPVQRERAGKAHGNVAVSNVEVEVILVNPYVLSLHCDVLITKRVAGGWLEQH